MSVDTNGKIKGFVRWEKILNYIKQKYDSKAVANIERTNCVKLADLNFPYTLNPHSDSNIWNYYDCGFITFDYYGSARMLFYHYENIREYEEINPDESEICTTETTFIKLGCQGESAKIITDIVAHFGGGWVDKNDCDDEPYLPIVCNPDKTIKPVKVVTMQEIYDKFGCIVVIKK